MKVFAHRGISALYPENSRTAISACKDKAFHGIEVDLFQAEQKFFVVHDPWLSRLFGINKKVTECSDEEITQLVCQDHQAIPTLEWLISELAEQELTLNIELKTIQNVELFINQLADYVVKYDFDESKLLISSFNHPYLQTISRLKPNWKIGLLLAHHPLDIKTYLNQMPIHSLHLCIDAISSQLIEEAKQNSTEIYVYTVDQFIDINFLHSSKVDGIFANHPEQAYKIVNKLI